MKKSLNFLFSAIMALGVVTAPGAVAAPLGYQDPLGWAGSGARINSNNANVVSDVSPDANVTTYISHDVYMASINGWAESSAYVLKGSIYASGTDDEWQAGGYFRDELYFATANGQPAELALTFSVAASGEVGPGGYAWLNLGMNVPMTPIPPTDWYYLSNKMLINETAEGQFSTSTAVTLKSTDWFSDYLVQSGSYLPISVGLWGTVKDASLSWGDTVQLVSVQAYQGGLELDASQFTILSNNHEAYFDNLAHGAVPVPAAAWLLGSGLLGLIGVAWRKAA